MSHTPRVAFVAGTLGTGGAEKQLLYMARALSDSGMKVAVFSMGYDDEYYARRLRQSGIELWTANRPRARILRLVRLLRALRRFRPDIIQASHFYVTFYAILAGWVLRRPVLGALRGDLRATLESHRFWGRWLLRLPTAIVANSHAALAAARALGLDVARMRLVTNVVNPGKFDYRPPGPTFDGRVTAIVVANLVPVKRLDRFVDALCRSRYFCPAIRGIIVGDGPLAAELGALAADRGLDRDALEFAGAHEAIEEFIASASFLCLTSSSEGTPNVVLEAMAVGRPVVAMDAGDVARIVEDGVTGFIVPQNDVTTFAARMAELAADPELRARMGRASRERIVREFSSDTLACQLTRIYCGIIGTTPVAPEHPPGSVA